MIFEKAWRFLKASRQTELGEFHPDFPSSYGPVVASHGTPQLGAHKINEMGIDGRNKNYFYTENNIQAPENEWLNGGYWETGGGGNVEGNRAGFGIREGFFQPNDMKDLTHDGRAGAVSRPIPRQFITPLATHPFIPIQQFKENKQKYLDELLDNDMFLTEYWGHPPKEDSEEYPRYQENLNKQRQMYAEIIDKLPLMPFYDEEKNEWGWR